MTRFKLLVPALAVLVGVAPAGHAQEQEDHYDRIDLSATAEREIENDLLIADLYDEVEANDQADAADQVNRAIQWAIDQARDVEGIEVETGQYHTRPVYANGRRIVGWVARQSLRLESQDAEALSDLLGTLQERIAIQSMRYGLSEEARDTAEEALIAEALQQFRRRAELIASELGREGYQIVRLSVGTGGPIIPFAEARMAVGAAADVAAPAIEAGRQTVSVSVSGTVELNAPVRLGR